MGWEIGGCVLVAVGLEVVVDDGFGCVFGGIDSTIERFSSTSVLYLFDIATVYVTHLNPLLPLKVVMKGLDGLFLVTVR